MDFIWQVYMPFSEMIPVDDWEEHEPGELCHCRPEYDENGVLMHRSFDGREDFERGLSYWQ